MQNKLKDKRIILKNIKPTKQNAEEFFKIVDKNRKHLGWLPWVNEILTVEDALKYLLETEKDINEGYKIEYGIYLDDELIGDVDAFNIRKNDKSIEIGYWISEEYSKQGYTKEAINIFEKELFKNFHRIQIKCDSENKNSIKLAESCGYKLEGELRDAFFSKKFNSFRNNIIFSKLKTDTFGIKKTT